MKKKQEHNNTPLNSKNIEEIDIQEILKEFNQKKEQKILENEKNNLKNPSYFVTDLVPQSISAKGIVGDMEHHFVWVEAQSIKNDGTYDLIAYSVENAAMLRNLKLDTKTPWKENLIDTNLIYRKDNIDIKILEENISYTDALFVLKEFQIRRSEGFAWGVYHNSDDAPEHPLSPSIGIDKVNEDFPTRSIVNEAIYKKYYPGNFLSKLKP